MRLILSLIIVAVGIVAIWNLVDKPIEKKYGLISHFSKKMGIVESSGLLSSRRHPGVFWTINDSGNGNELFAFTLDGRFHKTFEVQGGNNVDWEALAIDDQGNIFIADIGDNLHIRFECPIKPTLYQVKEPLDLNEASHLIVEKKIEVSYVGKKYNCEALCMSPGGELMLITRSPKPEVIYVLHDGQWKPHQQIKVKSEITGADVSDSGVLAVLSYKGITLFTQDTEKKWVKQKRMKMNLKQCEAICWDDGDLIVTNEEGEVYRINPR